MSPTATGAAETGIAAAAGTLFFAGRRKRQPPIKSRITVIGSKTTWNFLPGLLFRKLGLEFIGLAQL